MGNYRLVYGILEESYLLRICEDQPVSYLKHGSQYSGFGNTISWQAAQSKLIFYKVVQLNSALSSLTRDRERPIKLCCSRGRPKSPHSWDDSHHTNASPSESNYNSNSMRGSEFWGPKSKNGEITHRLGVSLVSPLVRCVLLVRRARPYSR